MDRRAPSAGLVFDEIGYWSEVKLDIVREYAQSYSKILARQPQLTHVYIDGFSGSGVHRAKSSDRFVAGSPLNALKIVPPFHDYFLVDLDGDKVHQLAKLIGKRADVHLIEGDCNRLLLHEVFPNVRYDQFRRGLCLLDPYGLQLNWEVIEVAGRLKTIDMFLNFPIMDMNRNALWRRPEKVSVAGQARMTAFWGDDSWRQIAYHSEPTLFGTEEVKGDNETIVTAFSQRLKTVAGFEHVAQPLAMRNKIGAVVYYLFFASQKPVAATIVKHIFRKYRDRRG
ncbi:MAG: three-Cys-motif partner protein TcmP [Deltaproteobacteria bacterium]|nr:three-Cys-motif partner protein TcmP [Deltaproteobacteria bacterium]